MKFVKASVTLTKEQHAFAVQKSRELARIRGGKPNLSGLFQELLIREQAKEKPLKVA